MKWIFFICLVLINRKIVLKLEKVATSTTFCKKYKKYLFGNRQKVIQSELNKNQTYAKNLQIKRVYT